MEEGLEAEGWACNPSQCTPMAAPLMQNAGHTQ